MGRTAGQFCDRDATYSLQATAASVEATAPAATSMHSTSDVWTWQQQQDFGSASVSERERTLIAQVDPHCRPTHNNIPL